MHTNRLFILTFSCVDCTLRVLKFQEVHPGISSGESTHDCLLILGEKIKISQSPQQIPHHSPINRIVPYVPHS